MTLADVARRLNAMQVRRTFIILGLLLGFSLVSVPREVRAEPMREFVMSCTYGALAGTLVGAATLAFSDKPGENLNKIARGASLGLYGGILLGSYIAFGVGNDNGDDVAVLQNPPRFLLQPVVSLERGLEGASATYTLVHW